jgi:hypothetical protein
MKKCLVVVVLVLTGLLLANCGSSNNVCEEAAKIMMDGMKEACQLQTNCCYCTCLLQGQTQDITQPDKCVCIFGGGVTGGGSGGGDCTGDTAQQAQECVNNVDACKQAAGQGIPIICNSGGIS